MNLTRSSRQKRQDASALKLKATAFQILPLVGLPRSKQDPIKRGHGARYLHRSPQDEANCVTQERDWKTVESAETTWIPDDGQTRVRQKQFGPDLREGQQRRLLLHAVGEGGGVADLQSGVLERHQPPLLQRRGQLLQQRLQQLRRRAPARFAHNLSHTHTQTAHTLLQPT
jgi:hypothetical protein